MTPPQVTSTIGEQLDHHPDNLHIHMFDDPEDIISVSSAPALWGSVTWGSGALSRGPLYFQPEHILYYSSQVKATVVKPCSALEPSVSTLPHASLEQATLEPSVSTLPSPTLEQATLEQAPLEQATLEQATLEQATLEQAPLEQPKTVTETIVTKPVEAKPIVTKPVASPVCEVKKKLEEHNKQTKDAAKLEEHNKQTKDAAKPKVEAICLKIEHLAHIRHLFFYNHNRALFETVVF